MFLKTDANLTFLMVLEFFVEKNAIFFACRYVISYLRLQAIYNREKMLEA